MWVPSMVLFHKSLLKKMLSGCWTMEWSEGCLWFRSHGRHLIQSQWCTYIQQRVSKPSLGCLFKFVDEYNDLYICSSRISHSSQWTKTILNTYKGLHLSWSYLHGLSDTMGWGSGRCIHRFLSYNHILNNIDLSFTISWLSSNDDPHIWWPKLSCDQ